MDRLNSVAVVTSCGSKIPLASIRMRAGGRDLQKRSRGSVDDSGGRLHLNTGRHALGHGYNAG